MSAPDDEQVEATEGKLMNHVALLALALSLAGPALCQSPIPTNLSALTGKNAPLPAGAAAFVHAATAASLSGTWTTLDRPELNGKPGALVFVTPNYNPGGAGGAYVTAPLGVWYTAGKWTIFSENRTPIPEGASFNIFATPPGANAFVHSAAVAGTATALSHPALDGKPGATILVSHDYGMAGPYLNAPLAVRYRNERWEIVAVGGTIPAGARFHVYIASGGVARASEGGVSGHILTLQGASAANRNALFFATPVVSGDADRPSTSGVYWNGTAWTVFQEDRRPLAPAAAYHVAALAGGAAAPPPANPATIAPGALSGAALLPIFTNWDFRDGLRGWTATGNAFASQPTVGDNVNASRVPGATGLGGDYWQVPFPIGNRGKKWIGTYENRPNAGVALGTVQGDAPTGTLTSPTFGVGAPFLTFLIGGGEDMAKEHVALEVQENGAWREVLRSTGDGSECMRRQTWNVAAHRGKPARIVIRDLSGGAWGHINVADFQFLSDDPAVLPVGDPGAITVGPLPGRPERRVPLDVQGAVFGVADLHTHPAAQLGFGGRLYAGNPTVNITQFGFCEDEHGRSRTYLQEGLPPAASADFITAMEIFGGVLAAPLALVAAPALLNAPLDVAKGEMKELGSEGIHSGVGYPAFQSYKFSNALHHHMHVEWIRRAFDGGLRLMVAHPVNNELLGNLAPKYDGQPLDDRSVADRQLAFIKNQIVGPNASWMEIAYTPADARRIIRQGKLAVILGLEVDAIGNWRQTNPPTPEQYQAEVQRLFDLGVRHLFPVHFADNAFGGSAVSGDLFNINNFYFNGKFQDVVSGDSLGLAMKLAAPNIPPTGNFLNLNNRGALRVSDIAAGYARARGSYGSLNSHRNAVGAASMQAPGLDKMMSLGMIVDIDHMSQSLRETVLGRCEQASANGVSGYPVVCGHTAFRELSFTRAETPDEHLHAFEADQSAQNARRIVGLGGMVSVITCEKTAKRAPGSAVPADAPGTSKATAQLLTFASSLSGPERGIGIGTDMAMLGGFGPRFGVNAIHGEVAPGGLPGVLAGALGMAADSTDAVKDQFQSRRTARAFAERNGVIYDQPVQDHYRYRFFYSRDYRGYERKAIHTAKQRDFLEALAIQSAGKTGESANQPSELTGRARVTIDTINAFCKGLRETRESDVRGYAPFNPFNGFGTFADEMRAAYFCSRPGIEREADGVRKIYNEIKPVWDSWQGMRTNPQHPTPLRKLVYRGTADGQPYVRDFDINLDGFAHYGMLPDALQELTDVGLDAGTRTAMFKGAEQYLQTWEKAWSMRR